MKEVEHDSKWENEPVPEAEGENVEEALDPFAPENIAVVQAITTLRLYDATMAVLTHLDPNAAKILAEYHEKGGIFSPPPLFDPDASIGGDNGDN